MGSVAALGMTPPNEEAERELIGLSEGQLPIGDARLARLEEQERVWLLWLSRLHEHHVKVGSEETRIVLEIAKRRWMAAKAALDQHLAGSRSN